jgi:hypothetical protein
MERGRALAEPARGRVEVRVHRKKTGIVER